MTMTRTRETIVQDIEAAGVVAISHQHELDTLQAVIEAIAAGGVRALELAVTAPGAVELIRGISQALPEGFLLGAGTVLDAVTARRAIDAGAQFVGSPVWRPGIIAACHEAGIPSMPGCFTATEILNAWEAGADIVKIFPATALGPTFLQDIRGPLPQVKLMPTAGVTVEDAGDWIRAGAVALGVGTPLLDPQAIADGYYSRLRANAERIVENVRAARVQH
jgi:2-dehydro-3-deoxyphosphogluconate aldolase / (4S)-4-hydroxy-2-oxoglutarate aldolase